MPVKKGDKIKIDYTGTLDDGTVFDSTQHEGHSHPLEFEVGTKQVIPGFEKAVTGMNKGEEKEFRLKPNEAYGDHNPELIKKVPKDKLPPEVKEGMLLGITLPNGQQMPVKVTKVTDNEVTIDLNHPLVGKALNFKIKILEIIPGKKKEDEKLEMNSIKLEETPEEIEEEENNKQVTVKEL